MKINRNDPCPCGSGRKYKQCCLLKEAAPVTNASVSALDIPKTIQSALAHLQAGRLREAVALSEQITLLDPNQPDALHLLGVIAHQLGKNEMAIELIDKAIKANPHNPHYYSNSGNMLYANGRQEEAVERFRQALILQPNYASVHYDLAIVLQAQGKLKEATESYRQAVKFKPDFAEAHNNLGTILKEQGEKSAAAESYRRAINFRPEFAEAHYNLGNILAEQNRLDEATESYRQTIALRPDFPDAHHGLGMALEQQGQLDAAVASYRQALALRPDYANAHFNLGYAYQGQGRIEESIASYCEALKFKPDLAEAYINVGILLQNLGRQEDAIAWLERSLAINTRDDWQIASLLLTAYWISGLHEEARNTIVQFKATVESLEPDALDKSGRGSLIFFILIAALVNNLEKQSELYTAPEDAIPLNAFGESHCLIPANASFTWHGDRAAGKSHLVRGIKMHHLASGEENQYKACLAAQLASTPSSSHLLFTIGEIDCRPDEGIWRVFQKKGRVMEEIIATTVNGYLDWLTNQLTGRQFRSITVQGISAPRYSLEGLIEPKDRVAFLDMIRRVNLYLKNSVNRRGWRFLDVYGATSDENGTSNITWHLDSHHVQPLFYAEAEKWIR